MRVVFVLSQSHFLMLFYNILVHRDLPIKMNRTQKRMRSKFWNPSEKKKKKERKRINEQMRFGSKRNVKFNQLFLTKEQKGRRK